MKVIEGFNEFFRKMSADEEKILHTSADAAKIPPLKSATLYIFIGVMISAHIPPPVLTYSTV